MLKVLVMGGSGMLGHQLCDVFKKQFVTSATFRGDVDPYRSMPFFEGMELLPRIDALEVAAVADCITRRRPDVVVNAIGVVKQDAMGGDAEACRLVNAELPHHIASACADVGARFIGISTDCVFSGKKGLYKESDPPDATDVYGKSKLEGEVLAGDALTIRSSIIGRELAGSQGLLEWFLGNSGRTVKGYRRAVFSGFPTRELADILAWVIAERPDLRGLYHLSADPISKYELLRLVNEVFSAQVSIQEDREFVIDRSLDSARFREATGFRPRPWEDMVHRMFEGNSRYEEWRKR